MKQYSIATINEVKEGKQFDGIMVDLDKDDLQEVCVWLEGRNPRVVDWKVDEGYLMLLY